MAMITMIKKRDGRQVPFNIEKIASAIYKAAQVVGGNDYGEAMKLADEVCQQLSVSIIGRNPSVEEVQDMVEKVLIEGGPPRRTFSTGQSVPEPARWTPS